MADVKFEWLGRVPYQKAWQIQKETEPNTVLFVEHPPTYTFGRRGKLENLVFTEDQLHSEGIETIWVDRGGDVTYHGPGQLVCYPILNLYEIYNSDTLDTHRYLRDLEQVIIDTLAQLNIPAHRFPGYTGVWVNQTQPPAPKQPQVAPQPLQIAAIGVKITGQGITQHGFALNIHPNLHHFTGIIPCGITDYPVTSIQSLTNSITDLVKVKDLATQSFQSFFETASLSV